MKGVSIALLVLLISAMAVQADEWDHIRERINTQAHRTQVLLKAFRAAVHVAEEWELPEICFSLRSKERLLNVVKELLKIIDFEISPVRIIDMFSETLNVARSVATECGLDDDAQELEVFCQSHDCSSSAFTRRGFIYRDQIQKLVEEMWAQTGLSDQTFTVYGRNFGKMFAILLGLSTELRNMLQDLLSA